MRDEGPSIPSGQAFPAAELLAVEAAVQHARRAGIGKLRILGWGELSVVIGWNAGGRFWACKRLPPFASRAAYSAYARHLTLYEQRLRRAGVPVLDGQLLVVSQTEERPIAYLVQPAFARHQLLSELFAVLPREQCAAQFEQVITHTLACTSPRLGFDAQLSNWALPEGRLVYCDTTSALIRDEAGRTPEHADLFIGTLPSPLQGFVRAHMLESARDEYFAPRAILGNALANLYKEGIGRLVPMLLARVNARLMPRPPLRLREIRRCYLTEELRWGSFQLVRRFDALLQRWVHGRPAEILLPPRLRSPRLSG